MAFDNYSIRLDGPESASLLRLCMHFKKDPSKIVDDAIMHRGDSKNPVLPYINGIDRQVDRIWFKYSKSKEANVVINKMMDSGAKGWKDMIKLCIKDYDDFMFKNRDYERMAKYYTLKTYSEYTQKRPGSFPTRDSIRKNLQRRGRRFDWA